ncbi:MAG: type II toxin-antitoxin system VapC family toxin [Candidatus Eremiobacteraeota bacterium]|nr:type II toxin-antitoxin system VapC family toxin [Candidatus Eremiobacteraeota bacterium]
MYFPEPDSGTVNELLQGRGDIVISQLAITEMSSALARRCRDGGLDNDAAAAAHKAVLGHIDDGLYECVELLSETHREAERILFSTATPLRASDALHLALARSARARSLLTFDVRMANAGRTVGLLTILQA